MPGTMTAIRTAIRRTLIQDGELLAMLGGPRVYHRYVRKAVEIPEVTYFDFASHPDPRMPLLDLSIQVDVWDSLLDDAELKATRIVRLLDVYEAEALGLTPFTVSTGELNLVSLRLESERDDIAGEAPEIARKTLQFRLQGFEVAT